MKQRHPYRESAARRPYGRGVLLACVLVWAGAAHGETLKEVVEATLKTHPRVLVAAAQERAATHDVSQARAGYLPSVDINLAAGRERADTPDTRAARLGTQNLNRRESGLLITQKLFDGNATSSEIDRQTARLNVAGARLAEVREEIAFRTAEVYLQVLQNRQLVKLANDNLRAHFTTQDKVRLRVQGGVAQRTDLQQVQGRIALSKSVVSARAGRLREAEANYQAVVGRPAGDLEEPSPKDTETVKDGTINADMLMQSIRQMSDAALAANPAISAAEAEVAAAEASVRGAKSPYYPRLNLEFSSNRNSNLAGTPGDVDSDALMLVLRWNLFRGGADQAQERALIERRFAARDTVTNTRREVEERVALALNAKATSEERLAYLREHATLSVDVLDSFQQQLELGRRTLLDVLNAESELFQARSNLIAGRYEDLINQYAILAAQGLLVKSLGIKLND